MYTSNYICEKKKTKLFMNNSELESKVNVLENKIQGIEEGIKHILSVVTENFSSIGGSFESVSENFKTVSNNFESVESKINSLESKVDVIDKRIYSLHGDTDSNFKEVKMELKKINYSTGYVDQFNNAPKQDKLDIN